MRFWGSFCFRIRGSTTGSPKKVLQQGFQGLGCKVHEGSTRLACEIRVLSGLLEVRVWVWGLGFRVSGFV